MGDAWEVPFISGKQPYNTRLFTAHRPLHFPGSPYPIPQDRIKAIALIFDWLTTHMEVEDRALVAEAECMA